MFQALLPRDARAFRILVQWAFFAWIVYLGVRFWFFVRHFESGGTAAYMSRPPGVEGFLPIGALVSLKHWVTNGIIDHVHPAALVLFLTFVAMAFLARKSFCSWLCPVGTLSEGCWKLGGRIFGRNFKIWRPLDIVLRGLKYALLAFFVKIILIDMPAQAIGGFLQAPYWAISDVKMLHFFTNMSLTVMVVIGALVGLSLLYRNFWCRYLCPYGALLGLISLCSPMAVRRDPAACVGCSKCTRACPSRIDVEKKSTVINAECTGCLSCVSSCPTEALSMKPPFYRRFLPSWSFAVLVLALFFGGVGLGMLTGHWQTSLEYQDYMRLIPMARMMGH
jgi:polyferredoxin